MDLPCSCETEDPISKRNCPGAQVLQVEFILYPGDVIGTMHGDII
jgi:hypothetical protein